MSAASQLATLKSLPVPALTTSDAAAVLCISLTAASQLLRRLASNGLVVPIRRGLWTFVERPDPLTLLEYLTVPYPAYISLQSALHLHGMIEQIPSVIYAVSIGRSARLATRVGTYSIHHVEPGFFAGFDFLDSGIKLATPEKALVDVFYLSSTRTRLFSALPEIELPRSFSPKIAREWVARIPSQRLRAIAQRRLKAVLERPSRRANQERDDDV